MSKKRGHPIKGEDKKRIAQNNKKALSLLITFQIAVIQGLIFKACKAW